MPLAEVPARARRISLARDAGASVAAGGSAMWERKMGEPLFWMTNSAAERVTWRMADRSVSTSGRMCCT